MAVFCNKCGHKNENSSKFCKGCGVEVVATCPDGTLQSGTVLDNRYEIKKLIKSGGMGSVYEAHDTRFNNTRCAVKEMLDLSGSGEDPEYFIKRFREEAEILYNLRHASLPGVKDYFIEGSRYYLVMNYIEGKDLDTIIEETKGLGLPENTVIGWTKEILDVLDYLHCQNPPVIYRDMKPANLMLQSSDNRIMLVDFGLARTVNPGSQTTKTSIGTPAFAPPELFEGKPEPRTDLYCLGGTIHALLTGNIPVGPYSFKNIKEIKPEISEGLSVVVMKALSLNIEERYTSAKEMKQAIEDLANSSKLAERSVASEIQPETKTLHVMNKHEEKLKEENGKKKGNIKNKIIIASIIIFLLIYLASSISSLSNYKKGMEEMKKCNYEKAVKYFNKSLKTEASIEKGLTFINLEQYDNAQECFNKITSKKYEAYVLACKGLVLTYKNKYEEGKKFLDEALKTEPDSPEVLSVYGRALTVHSDYEEAIKYLNKAISIKPDCMDALNNMGMALYKREKTKNTLTNPDIFDKAVEYYTKALNVDADNVEILLNKGLALYEKGNRERQKNYITEKTEEFLKDKGGLLQKEELLDYNSTYKEAMAVFDKAIELNNVYGPSYRYKGMVFYVLKKYEKAYENFKKAVELHPSDLQALDLLRDSCERQGNYSEAKKYAEEMERIKKSIK